MSDYHLYILYSSPIDQFYLGISHDPKTRLIFHNSSHKGWTRRGRPWQLIFTRSFRSRVETHHWERWLKSQKDRRIIEKIVSGEFNWTQ